METVMVAVMAAMFGGPGLGEAIASAASHAAVTLRVVPHASLDAVNLARAEATVRALLATGGVGVDWCSYERPACAAAPGRSMSLVVLLLPLRSSTGAEVCGMVTRDVNTRDPTVVIHMPCITDRVRYLRSSVVGRSHPALATVDPGHLAGLTIAHEVGHALGLQHARSGIMQPRFDNDDVLALQTARIGFRPEEGARMQSQLASRTGETASQ